MDLKIERVDLTYKSNFADPQFSLLSAPRVLHFLFVKLKEFGVRSSDLKMEGNISNLPEFSITCTLPGLNSVLRIRVDALELNAFAPAVANTPPVSKIAGAALAALKDIGGAAFSGTLLHEVVWAAHGTPSVPAMDYLRGFLSPNVPAPPSGLAFTLNPDQSVGRQSANVAVALSAVVPKGLYLQINAGYDGRLSTEEVRVGFGTTISATLDMLNITQPK